MSESRKDYGLLINPDIKLHRNWFKQMTSLIGINCGYFAPTELKEFDLRGDLEALYQERPKVGCIFDAHPDQKSLRKMGWVAELQTSSSLIHVPYDLEDLQVGALFLIPSGIDGAPPRVFRVISMLNIMIYPASISCEIAPEYFSVDEPHLFTKAFEDDSMPLLRTNEEDD